MAEAMLSVTDLSTYLYCKRKLYLKKVLKFAEPVKDVMVLGTVRHLAFEGINNVEEKLAKAIATDLQPEDIHANYKQEYAKILRNAILQSKRELTQFQIPLDLAFQKAWPSVLVEAKCRANNVLQCIATKQVFGDALWEQLTPKIQAEVRIEAPQLFLKGIIDQVEIFPEHIVPVELKTGKAPLTGIWPGHRAQVSAYMVLAEDALGKPVREGRVRYLDTGEDRPIPANPFIRVEVTSLVGQVRSLLDATHVPSRLTNEAKCRPCGLRNQCFSDQTVDAQRKRILKA
ncbi:MAG TPA: PD-(D/E)XK nuclease family protein [Candidatus Nanoarchaeia archaeon]|nr:PD-(D/E)XK nuclease family protein [Candidatus Nanoarchaeia archaeon]